MAEALAELRQRAPKDLNTAMAEGQLPDMGGQGASVVSSSAALPMQRKHWVRFP